ncbi:hypothetical protein DL96DRAFT_1577624 [Flagelloscypha sp. PMI_526]|nr:hypothetical protein DL96DRAFT_1577624 [Flagelloscypha sp. PMI_526]
MFFFFCSSRNQSDFFCRLSVKIMSNAVSDIREDRKRQTYLQISSNLAKVSPKAAEVLAAAVTNVGAESLGRSERDAAGSASVIQELWEEVFQIVETEVEAIIANQVSKLFEALLDESKVVKNGILESKEASIEAIPTRPEKRIKTTKLVLSTNSVPSLASDETLLQPSPNPESPNDLGNGLAEMLIAMQKQFDEQAEDLHRLQSENNAVCD